MSHHALAHDQTLGDLFWFLLRQPVATGDSRKRKQKSISAHIFIRGLPKKIMDAAPAPLVNARRTPRRVDTLTRVIAGAVFLVALTHGTAFTQVLPNVQGPNTPPILRQGTIHEENLSEPMPSPIAEGHDADLKRRAQPAQKSFKAAIRVPATASPLLAKPGRSSPTGADDGYELPPLSGIGGSALPHQRRASLKLVQQGQELLRTGKYRGALAHFERAIDIDTTNPYSHYFVGRAHYFLENYRESLSFLEVAEERLTDNSQWLAEILALRARNATALGFHGQADNNYIHALRLNPLHRLALAMISNIRPLTRAPQNE